MRQLLEGNLALQVCSLLDTKLQSCGIRIALGETHASGEFENLKGNAIKLRNGYCLMPLLRSYNKL